MMNQAEVIIEMIKLGKDGINLAKKAYDIKLVDEIANSFKRANEFNDHQVLFLEKETGAWMCLVPMRETRAYAWARSLSSSHRVLIKKEGSKELTTIEGYSLPPQETIEILQSFLSKPLPISEDIGKWVEDNNSVTYDNYKKTFKVIKLQKILPLDNTTADVAALSMFHLPETYCKGKDPETNEEIEIPVYPIKKLHKIPTYKSKGHSGRESYYNPQHEVTFKSQVSSLPALEPGEDIEEDSQTFKVFCASSQRFSFWLREAQKRGQPISVSRATVGSDRSRYRIHFYKTRKLWEVNILRQAS